MRMWAQRNEQDVHVGWRGRVVPLWFLAALQSLAGLQDTNKCSLKQQIFFSSSFSVTCQREKAQGILVDFSLIIKGSKIKGL